MEYNSLSLSQPLRGGGYNEYLLGKMQNKNTAQTALSQAEQNITQQSLLDSVSGFASELRSQNLVKALAVTRQNGLAPTLAEQGAVIDENGTVTLPETAQKPQAVPENSRRAIPVSVPHALPLERKTSMALQGMKAIALDSKSLGILSRISARKENPALFRSEANPLQNKFNELSEKYSLGSLSKKYESANTGSQSIGYDRNGGTSYGTYQISSRAGTFDKFLEFLQDEEPQWAQTLKNAGNANTGSRNGAVPEAWKTLCAQNPGRMKELEHNFIVKSHYEPVYAYVREKWQGEISPALKEVIFSTSVQHGVNGAKHIIDQALSAMTAPNAVSSEEAANSLYMEGFAQPGAQNGDSQAQFIKNIYENRKDKFTSSTAAVQEAARSRFIREERDALAMLA